MIKVLTIKPGDPDVKYYSATVRQVNGRFYEMDGNGKFVYDFFHDCDDLIGKPTITEQEALAQYSKYFDSKEFYNLYA